MNKDLTILMTSCDAYSDVLKIHDELFRRHWRNCPFDKILAIDKLNYDMQDYSLWNKIIEVGRNAEGVLNGQRVTEGLRHVTTPYVLLLQEDFLLYDNVDTELIRSIEEKAQINSESKRLKYSVPTLLNKIMYSIPVNVQLTSITNSGTKITITAQSDKYEPLGIFVAKLGQDGILKNVVSDQSKKQNDVVVVTIEGELP